MDEQQQRRIDEAAEQFANAVRESYRTVAERSISAQDLNAEMAEQFYNSVIEHLQSQVEGTRQLNRQLADQRERQQEAVHALTQEAVSAYMDFINSMLSFYQTAPQAATRSA